MDCSCKTKNILKIKYLDNYDLEKWGEMKHALLGDACFDARAAIEQTIIIKHIKFNKIDRVVIPLGFKVELPFGYEIQIRIRSGIAKKNGITMTNGIGTIDYGYRGEVMALISNLGNVNAIIQPGTRICQCKIATVPNFELITVSHLSDTNRGERCFGSTGDM